MAKLGDNKRRFKNPLSVTASTAAQQLLMKPAVWGILNVHVHGEENLEGVEEPFIAIANHSSHFDAPLIMGALPARLSRHLATGAAADTFFTKRSNALAIELFMNAYPVNRGATRDHRGMSKQLLSDGVPLFIFPEGTRSRTGGMGPFTPGVAALAISFNCQVLPAAIVGSYAAWPARQKRWNPGRPDVHVVFGLPMRPRPGEIAHEFNERMRRKVIEMHDSTATAYSMPTQNELAHIAAIEAPKKPKKDDK
ncbi:lysophospholipid acyltransferase family protein [Propionimicrobium sp. PCR01-08-3]|uniref:lysophospholipid acyltransferase family protein n=1 Tax=Propionimicrobium sp. PCR01-08-3 TaxID=3052086 RepID=UPI00333E1E12